MTVGSIHHDQARPGFRLGRAFLFLAILSFIVTVPDQGWTRPVDSVLDLLQGGARPALGLGGDPFLSPSLRETGWWHQDLFDNGSQILLQNYQYLPVTRKLSGGESELELAYTRLGGRYSVEGWGRKLDLGLSLTSVGASAAVDGDLASLSYGENGTSVGAMMRLEGLAPGLDVQIGVPLGESSSRHSGDGLVYGFHYTLLDRLYLTSHWTSWNTQERIVAVLDGEEVVSPLNLNLDSFNHEGRLALLKNLAFEMRISESDYDPRNGLAEGGYEFLPEAWSMSRQQSLEWEVTEWFLLLGRHSDARIIADGGAYWEGQRYLRLSHTYAQIESNLAAAQVSLGPGRRIFAEVEMGDFDAFIRLDVDSWRFASWEQAWLGAKKIVQIDGQGRWERYHLAYEGPWGAWSLGGGLSYYEIYPFAYSESWVHIPLVRPMDYEKSELATRRISLGAVSLQAERQFGGLIFSAKLQQFVYGNDHTSSSTEPTPPPPPTPEPGTEPSGWFGGTYAAFSVGYSF